MDIESTCSRPLCAAFWTLAECCAGPESRHWASPVSTLRFEFARRQSWLRAPVAGQPSHHLANLRLAWLGALLAFWVVHKIKGQDD